MGRRGKSTKRTRKEGANLLVLGSGLSGKNSRLTGRNAPGVLGAEPDPDEPDEPPPFEAAPLRPSTAAATAAAVAAALEDEGSRSRELPPLLPPLPDEPFSRDDTGYWSVFVSSSCSWPRCCVSFEIGVSGGLCWGGWVAISGSLLSGCDRGSGWYPLPLDEPGPVVEVAAVPLPTVACSSSESD